jgi:hypothetical protein
MCNGFAAVTLLPLIDVGFAAVCFASYSAVDVFVDFVHNYEFTILLHLQCRQLIIVGDFDIVFFFKVRTWWETPAIL